MRPPPPKPAPASPGPRSARLAASLAVLATALLVRPAHGADRWPLWPSEIDRVAEPLRVPEAGKLLVVPEAHKLQALRALERYPTALVEPILLATVSDDAPTGVRREALHACLERQLHSCIPAALTRWQTDSDTGVRIAALRVLAQSSAHAELLLAALRDADESVRAEAAHTLARVTWPEDQLTRVRTALIAKLVDTAPPVRRAAARSLGLLGPSALLTAATASKPGLRAADPAPLALARLLVDPDPQVRQDVAEALGNLRDPRGAPPLIRALEAGDEVYVSRAMVAALAALPGPDVDAALLRLLDAPPRGLTHRNLGDALGRRPAPSPALIDGLVARIREEPLQPFVLDALLMYGSLAAPALRAAQARGLEPPLALAVGRLLAALAPVTRPPEPPAFPPATDPTAWQQRLADARDGLPAAAVLAAADPPWLGRAALGLLLGETGPTLRRPWLLALAAARTTPPADPVLHARLAGWAGDPALPALDRCLALAALGRSEVPLATITLHAAASDLLPTIRSCAAAAARDDELLAGLLRDPSPRVRAAASYTLAACPVRVSPATRASAALLAVRDPHPGVLRAAQATLTPGPRPACTWQLLDAGEPRARAPSEALAWVDLRWRDHDLRLPALLAGERRWLLLPAIAEATLAPPPELPTSQRPIQ